ncbi:hypothetical protein SUDANB95_06342 [Actinosynnema sp. ALI-1.44]
MPPTSPNIYMRQNEPWALQLLAAQRRLYSDAKVIYNARMGLIILGTTASVVLVPLFPQTRITIGIISGTLLFLLSVLGGAQEKRKAKEAASVQEELDTKLFQIPFNAMLTDQPTITLVSEAVRRYKGEPLQNWYSDTKNVPRPLDILLCQRSNLGWGSSLHRKWRTVLIGAIVVLTMLIATLALAWSLSFAELLASMIVPALPLAKELTEQAYAHGENARSKAAVEQKVMMLWRESLARQRTLREQDCRSIQDRILITRQTNASIPDWFNKINHDTHEAVMIEGTETLISQAVEADIDRD